MIIELNGVSIELTQLTEHSFWSGGNPREWQYSIENGTYWGIRPTLESAIQQAKIEIENLKDDFNFTDNDLACIWKDRNGIERFYHGLDDSCEF